MIINNVLHAEYSNYRRVQGRKVMQLIFEIPLECSMQAHQLLGEPGIGENQIQVGIARLEFEQIGDTEQAYIPPADPTITITGRGEQ